MSHVKVPCLALVVILALSCSVFGSKQARTNVPGRYALTLNGANCGLLKTVDGGAISAEVVNEALTPDGFIPKHIGKPKYEEFEIQAGFNTMTKPFYTWIQQSWTPKKYVRMNGSIVAMDFDYQLKSERQFVNALITETTIPAMDGGSKDPAYLTVKFAPEAIRSVKPSGKSEPGAAAKDQQKALLPHNFKLEIAGLDCSKVSRIESFTVKQKVVTHDVGETRGYQIEPDTLEFPNLKITLAESEAQPFLAWQEDFVLNGNNGQKFEKNGSLTFFSQNMKDVLATVRFYNMGICRLQTQKNEANSDAIKRVQVEMYVERMEFVPGKDVASEGTETTPATLARDPALALQRTLKHPG